MSTYTNHSYFIDNYDAQYHCVINKSELFARIELHNTDGYVVTQVLFEIVNYNGTVVYKSVKKDYSGVGIAEQNMGVITPNMLTMTVIRDEPVYYRMYFRFKFLKADNSVAFETLLQSRFCQYYTGIDYKKFFVNRNETIKSTADFFVDVMAKPFIIDNTNYNYLKYKRQYLDNVTQEWINIDSDFVDVPSLNLTTVPSFDLPFIDDMSYSLRLLIKDISGISAINDRLPTAGIIMTWGKDGAGFGKRWEHGVIDIQGNVFKNGILQPTIYMKKPSDPNPDNMEDGDVLIVYNDVEAFSSSNFPQEFGTGIVWGQVGSWPTDFLYWTSMASTSNAVIESFEASMFKGGSYPSLMFDNDPHYANGYFIPVYASPATVIIKFKGKISFISFTLSGWGQDHEPLNSPKSFAFFGSNDGHTWTPLFDTVAFTNTWKTFATAAMNNSGMQFEYLKMVFRTNQADNNASVATLICVKELKFNVSGIRYV